MKTLYQVQPNEHGALYAFEHNGMSITNPIIDESGMLPVKPEHYGFEVTTTGGGCTAHSQTFELNGKPVVMLLTDGDLNSVDGDTITATVCLYDADMVDAVSDSWQVNR